MPLSVPPRANLVSIHAPARGATGMVFASYLWREFQSTRPRGARLSIFEIFYDLKSFNPRAREGRDPSFLVARFQHGVSIHAPARGATKYQR